MDDPTTVWSECLELENDLTDKNSKDHDLKRARLKEMYFFLSKNFIDFASANASEERLWKFCFQRPIDSMAPFLKRDQESSVLFDWNSLLDQAYGFYTNFVAMLIQKYNIDVNSVGADMAFRPSSFSLEQTCAIQSAFRCLVYLGDIAKYRELFPRQKDKYWEPAMQYYRSASLLLPTSGKAHNQLGLLYNERGFPLEALFHFLLSITTENPSQGGKDDIKHLINDFLPGKTKEKRNPKEDSLENKFFSFYHKIYTGQKEAYSASYDVLVEAIDMIRINNDQQEQVSYTLYVFVIIIITTIHEYGKKLLEKEEKQENRHAYREKQLYLFAVLCNLGSWLAKKCLDEADQTDFPFRSLLNLNENNMEIYFYWKGLLQALSVICSWAFAFTDFIVELQHFETTNQLSVLLPTFQEFLEQHSTFCNYLIEHLIEAKGIDTNLFLEPKHICLKDDMELLGCVPFKRCHLDHFGRSHNDIQCYDTDETLFSAADGTAIINERIRRMLLLAKKLASNQFTNLSFDEATRRFTVADLKEKQKDRKRLMRVMAKELLRDQVSSLESNIAEPGGNGKGGSKQNSLSIVIFGLDVYLEKLSRIQHFLKQGQGWLVIVPLDILDSLDDLKKMEKEVGARARDVIRFFEQTFRANKEPGRGERRPPSGRYRIRVQKDAEKEIPWSSYSTPAGRAAATAFSTPPPPPPVELRPMLSCSVYFHRSLGGGSSSGTKVILVTDQEELTQWASEIYSLTVQSSDRFLLSMNV